ncbi:MAG: sulfatase-like hydrolase/transferase [Bacteroidaceae bacterium]|nr:sulfatase-like hydrolase/transferase [Bacteroidaceae bacterium]
MIDRVDQEIGKISDKLKEVGRYDNTLIIFLSDNGAQGGSDARTLEQNKSGEVGTAGSWHTQNSNWSQAGNSPWREYKNAPYEGGISAPFIAWYPGHIPAGKIVDGVGHIIDLAPTFYDLAKAKYPKTYKGHSTNALPGKSLTPVLFGKNDRVQRTSPLFWEDGNCAALPYRAHLIRRGCGYEPPSQRCTDSKRNACCRRCWCGNTGTRDSPR